MCPQVVLFALLDAYARNDRVAVAEHLENLAEWNRKGGFSPTIDRPPGQSVSHFVVRRVIAEAGPTVDDVRPAFLNHETIEVEGFGQESAAKAHRLGDDHFTPHFIHPAREIWCEEDGQLTARESWEMEPGLRTEVSPGDHVLLPDDWLDDDSAFEGELTEVAVVQREFQPDVADGDLRYFVVTPLFDDYREAKLSENCLYWGRLQWLAENATMGSGSHGAEEGGDDD
jgi:hypothetical protein